MNERRRVVAARIRRIRTLRGLPQHAIADFAGKGHKWAWNIENERAVPNIDEAEMIAFGLRVDLAYLLGLTEDEDPVKRRDFLRIAGRAAIVAGLDPRAVVDVLAAAAGSEAGDLTRITDQLGSWYWRVSPAFLTPLLGAHKATLDDLLRDSPNDQQLQVIAAETAVYAGLVAYTQDNHGSARREFEIAERLAKQAGDGPALASAYTAHQAIVSATDVRGGTPDAAAKGIELLNAAERVAGRDYPLLLVRIYCSRAEEHAAMMRDKEARLDLDRAAAALARARGRFLGHYDHWDEVRLQGWFGSCLLYLDQPKEAADILERVVPATPADLTIYRSAVEANLGAAYARTGQVGKCVELQLNALRVARNGGLNDGVVRVRRIRETYLGDYEGAAELRELDDALAG